MNVWNRALLLAAALAWSIAAQQPANQKKGFNANDVYQFNGIDTINVFNGNLTLAIPLGPSYAVDGGLSYGLTLVSNANIWEGQEICRKPDGVTCQLICDQRVSKNCDTLVMPNVMRPHPRANAGLGWTVSLGRLYQPDHPLMWRNTVWTYESPDGADHTFPIGDPETVAYSDDSSYLRMRKVGNMRAIDFPGGEVHWFGPPETPDGHWVLKEITNQFAQNYLRVSYVEPPSGGLEWRLTDSHGRTHTIHFEQMSYDGAPKLLVRKVSLSRFGSGTPAEITFSYTATSYGRGEFHNDPQTPVNANVQRLDSVTFPDGTAYTFAYEQGSGNVGYFGVPRQMTLPTGGLVEWTWGPYWKPAVSQNTNEDYLRASEGVLMRSAYGRIPAGGTTRPLEETRTYTPSNDCNPEYDEFSPPCREFTNTLSTIDHLTATNGPKTVHYFSVSKQNIDGWSEVEYGQPFTKKTFDGTAAPNTRWLSSLTLAPDGTTRLRSTYVRYEHDGGKNFRPASTRQVTEDYKIDNRPVYMDSDSSDWDGFGHYRRVKTSGTVPNTPTRETFTNYYQSPSAWLTGLYDFTTVKENGVTLKTQFCFDPTNGFLKRRRSIKDITNAVLGSSDTIAVFESDARGNVARESYYGGDLLRDGPAADSRPRPSVGTGSDLCTTTLGALGYQIEHTRVSPGTDTDGTMKSAYAGVAVNVGDVTIDWRSGLVRSSRDTAGVETTFEYDWAGRLIWEKPTGRAWTKYDYLTPSVSELSVTAYAPGSPTVLNWSKYGVDGFGRVVRETVAMPGNTSSDRVTTLDGLGRRRSVSELGGAASPLTTFTYDDLGRVKTVTAPDNALTEYSYQGDVHKTRTSGIWNGTANVRVSATESYDGYGRLIAVKEKSGPTSASNPSGAEVTTSYVYDPADRLIGVTMKSADNAVVQSRNLDYDGRGFLRWESQPEAGVTTYEYDARGHLARKTKGAASAFDVEHFYDALERITRIDARDLSYPAEGQTPFHVLKEFAYGAATATDKSRGKLVSATRYNYGVPNTVGAWPTWIVQDAYSYGDQAGRMTNRETTIQYIKGPYPPDNSLQTLKTFNVSTAFDDLDLPTVVTYPMCIQCGAPSSDPTRANVQRTYDRGRLKSVSSFTGTLGYWPNGLRRTLPHSNGIWDEQMTSVLPRPTRITIGQYDRCRRPEFIGPPSVQTLPNNGGLVLSVTLAAAGPYQYEWYAPQGVLVGVTEQVTVTPSQTTQYYVVVTNDCGYTSSQTVNVTVNSCPAPTTGVITAVTQPDGSWILTPDPVAKSERTYAWKKPPSATVIGTGETYKVDSLSQSTKYTLTIADQCGSETSEVTIRVPLQITATALQATWSQGSPSVITVTWPAVSGATSYRIERRSGTAWELLGSVTSPSYIDSAIVPSRTYAYRVYALGSGTESNYSNSDVATTMTFTPAVTGATVTPAPIEEMLKAVNKVRAAAGWPAVTWSNILAASDPLPLPTETIVARHIITSRARVNEALQALGVPVRPYEDPQVVLNTIKTVHVNEIQERAQ